MAINLSKDTAGNWHVVLEDENSMRGLKPPRVAKKTFAGKPTNLPASDYRVVVKKPVKKAPEPLQVNPKSHTYMDPDRLP